MAAVLAHEIRNPLGSIRGTAEILRDDYLPGDPKHEFIDIQIKETERLNRVVEDFLRMARPQAVEMSSCSLREELETIVTLTQNDAKKRGISLLLEPYKEEARLNGDGEKLRQAFLNIVINAVQATGSGGSVIITLKKMVPYPVTKSVLPIQAPEWMVKPLRIFSIPFYHQAGWHRVGAGNYKKNYPRAWRNSDGGERDRQRDHGDRRIAGDEHGRRRGS
jgi:Signal transduction histidine kinase